MEHPFLTGFARALNQLSIATLRFNFPSREAGRPFPDRPPAAMAAWRAAMTEAASRSAGEPLWAAGKSFGGRMASMAVADGMPAAGLVYLGYPLHPPGKPEKLRDEHLYGLGLPMLFLQGTRDPFATPELLAAVVARIGPSAVLQWRDGGGHSFDVAGTKRSPDGGRGITGRIRRGLHRSPPGQLRRAKAQSHAVRRSGGSAPPGRCTRTWLTPVIPASKPRALAAM